ncbi:MAG TPA: hypothetical protein PLR41_09115, partial [Alphaproteobacteria bacterium]|nr:hypothetical protein [Alphaproteobacteria bacterium]
MSAAPESERKAMEDQGIVIWVVVIAAILALAVAALALLRRGGEGAALAGRLDQLAAQQSAAQNALAERLQAQERALAA